MVLEKDGVQRILISEEEIKIFKDAGWVEVKTKPVKEGKKENK